MIIWRASCRVIMKPGEEGEGGNMWDPGSQAKL